jgi:hypothetical protein
VRSAILVFAFALLVSTTDCAAVLGLDSGNDVVDFSDAEAGAEKTDGEITPPLDSGPTTKPCAPHTADCNDNPADGCETMLSSPQHCGACTTTCAVMQSCTNFMCCTNDNLICTVDSDCCSGKCNGHNCGH